MGKLLALLVIVVAVIAVLHFATDGRISPFGSAATSEEEQTLERIEGRIRAAQRQIRDAGRAVAVSGVDATAGAEAALADLEAIEKELKALKRRSNYDGHHAEIDRLLKEAQSARAG